MPPIDLPPGDWTELLIGDQWPDLLSLHILSQAAARRWQLSSEFEQYVDLLDGISGGNLAIQEGIAADAIRALFQSGKQQAQHISATNRVKSEAYKTANQAIDQLRSGLTSLAAEGNEAIEAVNNSKASAPQKIGQIIAIVTGIKHRALLKATSQAGEIFPAIQNVLNSQGIDTSARAFALDTGVSAPAGVAMDLNQLGNEITKRLHGLDGAEGTGLPNHSPMVTNGNDSSPTTRSAQSTSAAFATNAEQPSALATTKPGPQFNYAASNSSEAPTSAAAANNAGPPIPVAANASPPMAASGNNSATPTSALNASNAGSPPITTAIVSPAADAAPRQGIETAITDAGSTRTFVTNPVAGPELAPSIDAHAPSTTHPPAPPKPHANLSPEHLAENFNAGNHTGAPVSAGTEAITTAAASPVHTAPPPPLSGPFAETPGPTSRLVETSHAVAAPSPEINHLSTSTTEFTQPVVAAPPAATMAPSLPPAAAGPLAMPPTPPSSLLAYGADLRPAAATPVTPPLAPSTVPGSAPINPAGGPAPTGQPAVVRHQPAAPTAPGAVTPGLTERAFAATAVGAAAGALAARATAESRLERLLAAVVRQQPDLNWAIGDREDGGTVLVTDVAGGWIPPCIEIPTGITLLQPADRRGDLATLLGSTTHSTAYRPGQYLSPANVAKQVSMSIRARDTAAVDDLGWELAQATKWRDGLPRLAHTLAKAVSARTGCLDSEVDLLRDHLTTVGHAVMAQYPGPADPAQVGNWQLLATIDALVRHQMTLANYHFAWFRAQVLTREGHR